MILGCGIDMTPIQRFATWHRFKRSSLKRVFSADEIDYCLANPAKAAERFAVRYAAKEACYKALRSLVAFPSWSFMQVARFIDIKKMYDGRPILLCQWPPTYAVYLKEVPSFDPFVSLSHAGGQAIALVILQEKK